MSKLSLASKVFLIVLIFIMANVLVASMALIKMRTISSKIHQVVDRDVKRLQGGEEIRHLFSSLIIDEKNSILTDKTEEIAKIKVKSQITLNRLDKKIDELLIIASEEGRKNLEMIRSLKEDWLKNYLNILELSQTGKKQEASQLSMGKGREIRLKVESVVAQIVERNQKRMREAELETEEEYNSAVYIMLVTIGLSLFTGILFYLYTMRKVSHAIDEVILNLKNNSKQVTSAANQIAQSSVLLSSTATEQSSSIEETSASIVEINSMVQKNAENARNSSLIAGESKSSADRGKDVVAELLSAIKEIDHSNSLIKNSVTESNKKIGEIVEVIVQIGEKTKVINDIVFQTKLLSFNASVEAARAGEHGKGFSVVAEEVGNLADMSGKASKEIKAMLDESIQTVQNIVSETRTMIEQLILQGNAKVERGAKIAHECENVLNDIAKNIDSVNVMSHEIAEACQEQAQGVTEITSAMSQLEQITQSNAHASEQTSASAEQLSNQANSLQDLVVVLTTTVKGEKATIEQSIVKSEIRPKPDLKPVVATKAIIREEIKHPLKENVVKKEKRSSNDVKIPSHDDHRFEDV